MAQPLSEDGGKQDRQDGIIHFIGGEHDVFGQEGDLLRNEKSGDHQREEYPAEREVVLREAVSHHGGNHGLHHGDDPHPEQGGERGLIAPEGVVCLDEIIGIEGAGQPVYQRIHQVVGVHAAGGQEAEDRVEEGEAHAGEQHVNEHLGEY